VRAAQMRNRRVYLEHVLRFCAFALLTGVVAVIGEVVEEVPAAVIGLFLVLAFASTTLARAGATRLLQLMKQRGHFAEVVAVVGSGPAAEHLMRRLQRDSTGHIELLGRFDDEGAADSGQGRITELLAIGIRRRIDWIVLAPAATPGPDWLSTLERLQGMSVNLGHFMQHLGALDPADGEPVLARHPWVGLLAERPIPHWHAVVKRTEDVLVGSCAALLLLPLMLLIALAIKMTSAGPVLFTQTRHGRNNREFEIYKFRSMRLEAAADDGTIRQTERDDVRVTPLGRVLRATSMDELPQLFNVLAGDMSLVGPRPHAIQMRTAELLGSEIHEHYLHRHRVKPGITGWAQVNGARGATATAAQMERRVELDLHYIEHWSLWLDLRILVMTIGVVMRRTNAF
jgi:Undecaprenyl-phosphate glucose phosphotransferase